MTWRQFLAKLRTLADDDGLLDEQVTIEDALDYAGIVGLEGASDRYFEEIAKVRASQTERRAS